MRAILFANGNLETSPLSLNSTDLIIAADGGAKHCLQHGIWPAYVVGDFDSLDAGEVEELTGRGVRLIRYPTRKDFTDLELALQHIGNMKRKEGLPIEEVMIFAALGSRWDQTIGNLLLASSFTAAPVCIIHGVQEIRFLHSGETLEITGSAGDTVSILSLSERAEGITTQGLEYPLHDEDLFWGSTRGISNVLTQRVAEIKLKEGRLAVMVIHHGWPSNQEEAHEG